MPIAIDKLLYAAHLRNPRRLTLPDFLGIGAQKSATTWLYENLKCHPNIFMSAIKEVHYFDDQFDKPLKWYANLFADAGDRLKGEITPAYGILPPARIRFIRRILRPDAKLILMLRNPIERAWSHALMTFCRHDSRRYEEVRDDEFLAHFAGDASVKRGDYAAILDAWLACFPKESLFIGYMTEVIEDPESLLRRIFAHLGVTNAVDWPTFPLRQKMYSNAEIPMPAKFRSVLEARYRPAIEKLIPRLGPRAAEWLSPQSIESGTP